MHKNDVEGYPYRYWYRVTNEKYRRIIGIKLGNNKNANKIYLLLGNAK